MVTIAFIACYQDIRYRRIANTLVVTLAAIGSVFISFYGLFNHLITALLIVTIGAVLFQLNLLAAGDSKLFAAFSLMIAPKFLLLTVCLMLVIGGVLALYQWSMYRLTGKAEWVSRGVAYGVPICIASLFTIAASL